MSIVRRRNARRSRRLTLFSPGGSGFTSERFLNPEATLFRGKKNNRPNLNDFLFSLSHWRTTTIIAPSV